MSSIAISATVNVKRSNNSKTRSRVYPAEGVCVTVHEETLKKLHAEDKSMVTRGRSTLWQT